MINLDTVLSEFDDRGTLLKYLNKVGAALNNASLKTVEVNQVSSTQVKLKFIFADDSYVESPVLTMPQGAQGVQGPQGPRGERGEQGLPGINGENGRDGKDGKDGKSFNIIGSVASTSQLPQTAPAGTAYFVGASAPRDVYVFATGTNAWVNQGKLQGPRGEAGPQGVSIQRIDFQSDYTMKVTLSNGTTYVSQSLRGPKGEPGASGSVDANKLHEIIVGSQHIVADLNSGGDKIEIRLDNAILESITNAISDISKLKTGKQDNLVSGTNIKSINGTSLLGSGDITIESGGGASGVQLSSPSTATNGTITQGQLATLQESDLNYIIFNNEIYSLNDKTHTADTLTYSHVGFENGKHLLKTISITVSTRAWVLNTTEVSSGGSGGSGGNQLYEHNIRIYNAYSAGFENNFFLKIISTKKTPYTINELNDYLIKNNYVCDAVGFPASKNLKYFGNSLECMILYADDTNSANFKIITTRLLISETKVDNYFNPFTPEQLYKNIEGSYHQNAITDYSGLSNIDDNVIVIE